MAEEKQSEEAIKAFDQAIFINKQKKAIANLSIAMKALGKDIIETDNYEEWADKEIFSLCKKILKEIKRKEELINLLVEHAEILDDKTKKKIAKFVREARKEEIKKIRCEKFFKLSASWDKLKKEINYVWKANEGLSSKVLKILNYIRELDKKDTEIIGTFFSKLKEAKQIFEKLKEFSGDFMKLNINTILSIEGKYERVDALDVNETKVAELRKKISEEARKAKDIFRNFNFQFANKYAELKPILNQIEQIKEIKKKKKDAVSLEKCRELMRSTLTNLHNRFDDDYWEDYLNNFRESVNNKLLPLFKEQEKILDEIKEVINARLDLIRRIAIIMKNVVKAEEKAEEDEIKTKRVILELHMPSIDIKNFKPTHHDEQEAFRNHVNSFRNTDNDIVKKTVNDKMFYFSNTCIDRLQKLEIDEDIKNGIVTREQSIFSHKHSPYLKKLNLRNIIHNHFFKYTSKSMFVQNENLWNLFDAINYHIIIHSEKNIHFLKDYVEDKLKMEETMIIPFYDIHVNYLDFYLYSFEKRKKDMYKAVVKTTQLLN